MNIFKAVENELQPQNNQQAVWLFIFFFKVGNHLREAILLEIA